MSFPISYREIHEMTRKTVLHTRVARGVARKAGLRRTAGSLRPQTIFDAYIDPQIEGLIYQWLVDLSGFSRIHLASMSDIPVYLSYNTNALEPPSEALAVGGWTQMTGLLDEVTTPISGSRADTTLKWYVLDESLQRSMRLGLSVNTQGEIGWPASSGAGEAFDGPFSVALQAF